MRVPLLAAAVSGAGLLLLAAAGPAYRMGLLGLPAAFSLLRWGAYAGLAGMAIAAAAAVWTYRQHQRGPAAVAAVAFLVGAVAFGIPYRWQRIAQSVPPIHDITTDLQNPPEFKAIVPLRAGAPNGLDRAPELAEQQRRGYPGLAPLTLAAPPDRAFDLALQTAQDMGWDIVSADRSAGVIEATDTTRWFGFKDDVVVRLTPWGSGTRVDLRSVSRVGRSDVGTNARRIQEFLEAIEDRA